MTTEQMSIKTLPASGNLISRLNALVERSSKFVYFIRRLSNYPLSSVRRDSGLTRGWQCTVFSSVYIDCTRTVSPRVLRTTKHFTIFDFPSYTSTYIYVGTEFKKKNPPIVFNKSRFVSQTSAKFRGRSTAEYIFSRASRYLGKINFGKLKKYNNKG